MSKQSGQIAVWFENRGFGFVKQKRDGKLYKLFLHLSQILSGTPRAGAAVLFNEGSNGKGPMTLDAEILGGVS